MSTTRSFDPIRLVASDRVLAAAAGGDIDTVVDVINHSPLEVWAGIAPPDFHQLLESLPARATANSVTVRAFRLLSNGHILGSRSSSRAAAPDLGEQAAAYFGARLRGAPGGVVLPADLAERRNTLFDATSGWQTFIALQTGLTELLSGNLGDALSLFLEATQTPPPATLSALLRDGYVKTALIHALYGDHRIAAQNLEVASTTPRTASWLEAVIDTHAATAQALLESLTSPTTAIQTLGRIPRHLLGELSPFHTLASTIIHIRARRTPPNLAPSRNALAPATTAAERSGYPAHTDTIAAVLTAMTIVGPNSTAFLLERLNNDLVESALLRALVLVRDRTADSAVRLLISQRPRTSRLPLLETQRQLLLAWALYEIGNAPQADMILTELTRDRDLLSAALIPERLHRLALRRVPGWPADLPAVQVSEESRPTLTKAERRLLPFLATDLTNQEIADALFLSPNTTKSQQRSLARKLRARNRTEAVTEAHRLGFL